MWNHSLHDNIQLFIVYDTIYWRLILRGEKIIFKIQIFHVIVVNIQYKKIFQRFLELYGCVIFPHTNGHIKYLLYYISIYILYFNLMIVKISTFLPLSSVYNRLMTGLNRKSSTDNITRRREFQKRKNPAQCYISWWA